jgi:hypothetical protein
VIVTGQLIDHLGACRFSEPVRDNRDPIGWRVRNVYEYQPVELRTVTHPCPITDGHGGRVLGLVQHVEVSEQGDAWIVGDLVAPLPAGDQDGKLYLSAEGVTRGEQLELRAVAICAKPAMMLRPIKITPEHNIAGLPETRTLQLQRTDPHTAGLLTRAKTAARKPGPLIVHDLRTPALTRGLAIDTDPDGRPHGPMHHGAPGQVLAVH